MIDHACVQGDCCVSLASACWMYVVSYLGQPCIMHYLGHSTQSRFWRKPKRSFRRARKKNHIVHTSHLCCCCFRREEDGERGGWYIFILFHETWRAHVWYAYITRLFFSLPLPQGVNHAKKNVCHGLFGEAFFGRLVLFGMIYFLARSTILLLPSLLVSRAEEYYRLVFGASSVHSENNEALFVWEIVKHTYREKDTNHILWCTSCRIVGDFKCDWALLEEDDVIP